MNEPDGFIGAVMAMEGITDSTALLHGQTGCRKGLLLSQKMCPRPERIIDTDSPVYAGFSVVPFSGINQGDYTGRSLGKLSKAFRYVSGEGYNLIAVICSPGISIVGDDCSRIVRECSCSERTILLENDDLGTEPEDGFDHAISAALHKVASGDREPRSNTVTVTGLSIMHKDWRSVRTEITDILKSMGLEPVCFAGAGCTVPELKDSINAEFVLDIAPDFSRKTTEFYRGLGLKEISIGRSPVGFDAIEALIHRIADATGKNPLKPLEELNGLRRRAYDCIIATDTDLRGTTFSVSAPESVKVPLTEFLEDSFSMVYSDVNYDVLFADGNRCMMEKASGKCRKCIDVGFPSNKVDFRRNPVLGMNGTMYLLDALFDL